MTSKYIKEIDLPTRGLLYDEAVGIPDKITIRAMTTKEEKMLLGSTTDAVEDIIKACVEKPKDLKVDELISPDVTNILVELRILTYGPQYKLFYLCENCNRKNTVSVDLTDLENKFLPEEFKEPFEIDLPMSKDKLEVVLLRGKDFKAIERWAKNVEKRTKAENLKGDVTYTLRIAQYIKTINGEAVTKEDALQYAESMIGGDSSHFWNKINELQIGFDVNLIRDCMYCGHENEFIMPVTAEFFRPTT